MPEHNLFQIFTSRINELGLRYMVTGAVASIIYGEPRFTHDIDLVIEVPAGRAEDVVKAFPLEEFYCPPIEVIIIETRRPMRGHFNIFQSVGFRRNKEKSL